MNSHKYRISVSFTSSSKYSKKSLRVERSRFSESGGSGVAGLRLGSGSGLSGWRLGGGFVGGRIGGGSVGWPRKHSLSQNLLQKAVRQLAHRLVLRSLDEYRDFECQRATESFSTLAHRTPPFVSVDHSSQRWSGPSSERGGWGNLNKGDTWYFCSQSASLPFTRSHHDKTTTPEP